MKIQIVYSSKSFDIWFRFGVVGVDGKLVVVVVVCCWTLVAFINCTLLCDFIAARFVGITLYTFGADAWFVAVGDAVCVIFTGAPRDEIIWCCTPPDVVCIRLWNYV